MTLNVVIKLLKIISEKTETTKSLVIILVLGTQK